MSTNICLVIITISFSICNVVLFLMIKSANRHIDALYEQVIKTCIHTKSLCDQLSEFTKNANKSEDN